MAGAFSRSGWEAGPSRGARGEKPKLPPAGWSGGGGGRPPDRADPPGGAPPGGGGGGGAPRAGPPCGAGGATARSIGGMTTPESRFAGQVAIVTGGAGGIGSAVARRLIADGARVALVDRDAASLRRVAHELADATLPIEADVSREEDV